MDAGENRRRRQWPLLTQLPRQLSLLLAFLIAVGVPLLHQLHEAEHVAHQVALDARGLPPGPLSEPDDDCGVCALCQLFAVAAAHQALVATALDVPLAGAASAVPLVTPPVARWTPGLQCQPPARGPPALAA
jgi:hypothetical protein